MEKQTVFIKRYPSKGELPKEDGNYIVGYEYGSFQCAYSREYSFHEEFTDCSIIEWWLEEIELPSEDEVKAELTQPVNISVNVSTLLRDMYEHGVDRAYNFILNKLKGE